MRPTLAAIFSMLLGSCARHPPPAVTTAARTIVAQPVELAPVSPPAVARSTAEVANAYAKRLDFHQGAPLVPVRLMEGVRSVRFRGRGRTRLALSGAVEKTVEGPEGATWSVHVLESTGAEVSSRIQLADLPFIDRGELELERARWETRGLKVRVRTIGSVYGIAGKVIDNRHHLVLLDEVLDAEAAPKRQAELLRQYSTRTSLFEEVERASSGTLELRDASDRPVGVSTDRIVARTVDGAPFEVEQVEFGVGYDFHGHEDRSYRGELELTLDRNGALAVVNRVSVEDLLKGLVPAEIYARAHPEALKAQAVTARGEVLAKIGLKHLADPYLLCAEQHCAVYRGLSGEAPTTSAAVEATKGESLFSSEGRLVDSVYSAVCGGHTENNESVWGGVPNPNLRGRPDTLPGRRAPVTPEALPAFLAAELPAACRLSSFSSASKYRWEKRFSAADVNRLTAGLAIGAVQAIGVTDRGVSGRARVITISGESGATQVRGELNIRKLFGMLNSSMFLVEPQRGPDRKLTGWVFHGGGWGHGVGMCQTGAIGRAEAGQSYRAILDHYFNGAEVARIY